MEEVKLDFRGREMHLMGFQRKLLHQLLKMRGWNLGMHGEPGLQILELLALGLNEAYHIFLGHVTPPLLPNWTLVPTELWVNDEALILTLIPL